MLRASAAPLVAALGMGLLAAAAATPSCTTRDAALLQARSALGRSPHEGRVRIEHRRLGCFPRARGDTDDEESFEDLACISAARRGSAQEPCRSGMPFFRLALQREQSYLDCFTFCLSKGLDLSGVVHSNRTGRSECRCGATEANEAAWHRRKPPAGLLLSAGAAVPQDDERCEVLVWQYTGPLEDKAVPTMLTQLSVGDEAYLDAIAEGMDPGQITEEDDGPAEQAPPAVNLSALAKVSLLSARGVCEDLTETGVGADGKMPCSQAKNWCSNQDAVGQVVRSSCPLSCGICSANGWMPCYPYACGPGAGPWQTKATDGKVYINYFYEGLDSARTTAFEKARDEWEAKTCVKFVKSSQTPRMRITVTNEDTCSAGVGYPGSSGTRDVNLGWCNSASHWGSIAHELGHALGMNHEQNRADGPATVSTPAGSQGPHLTVKWQNIEAAWRPFWAADQKSYIGSQTAGYAGYDYGSIMHYPLNDDADATNPAWQSVPGQRAELSAGDVAQFKDMYQC